MAAGALPACHAWNNGTAAAQCGHLLLPRCIRACFLRIGLQACFEMKSVSIVGASGIAGGELLRLIEGENSALEIAGVFGESSAGKQLCGVHKHLSSKLKIAKWEGDANGADLVFFATPSGFCAKALANSPELLGDCKVVDLSADFRLKNAADYPKWYGFGHPCPKLLSQAAYGLPELNAEKIKKAKLVANPGCYATSIILAAAPFAKKCKSLVVDSCSGVSGAGNSPSQFNSFCNAAEDVVAYAATSHKHLIEMRQELGVELIFTPHIVPVNRGILSTLHLFFETPVSQSELEHSLEAFYAGKKFVKIFKKPQGEQKDWMPSMKMARATNNCLIAAEADEGHCAAVVVSAIDNLVKGAAGQAIQNANLMLGLKEDAGLPSSPVFP